MIPSFNERTLCVGIFVASLITSLSFSAIGLHNSPFELHGFRQIQTALTAQALQQDGWSLAYPTPLFGPPWSVPMEFPLYQLFTAKLANLAGLQLETAARVVSLFFFYGSLPAFFGLMGVLGVPPARRWLLPALLLLSPVYLYYSRAFMIESTALCASAWFLLAYCRTLESSRPVWRVLALVAGIIAALVKVTTLAIFLVPAALYTLFIWNRRRQSGDKRWAGLAMSAFGIVLPAIIIGAAWVHYSDSVKSGNPLAARLVSSKLVVFNFGTLNQRFTSTFWTQIMEHATSAVLPAINLVAVLVFALVLGRTYRLRAAVLLLAFAAGPLVFANLYFVHDYYFYANGVFLLAALVLAWSQLLEIESFSRTSKWCVIAASLGLQLYSYFPDYYRAHRWEREEPPELGTILSRITEPEDVLLIFGQDWFGQIPYTAHRRAVMVINDTFDKIETIENVLGRIAAGQVTAMVLTGEIREHPDFIERYVKRLDLHPQPVLSNSDTVLYLAESRMARAQVELDENPPQSFGRAGSAPNVPDIVPRQRTLLARIKDRSVVAMMTPAPVQVIHPFGLVGTSVEDRIVFNAHAPTDLIFDVPARSSTVRAEFGVLDEAHSGKNSTDGIEFRVELVTPDGNHHKVHSVYLSPSANVADRGLKTFEVVLPEGPEGQLWLRTLPGPQNNISCDWAYWARIEIK